MITSYQKLIVYYFTGTGNAENVSLWLTNIAGENNIESRIVNIARIDRLKIEKPDPAALVVFVSPVHGFNYPPIMLHFIMRFPKGNNKVLLMNTRAGMLIGRYIVPGITGIAFYLSALILRLKGYQIKAMYPVDLPSNWISLHPGLNEKTIKYLHGKNKERVTEFANKVFSSDKMVFPHLHELILDALISPVAFGYYFVGRFMFAKSYYASTDCNNCDSCINGCPVKAIIKTDKRPFWTFNCECCMRCMSNCPRKAIETAHGFIIGFILIHSSVLSVLFYKYFELLFFNIENEIIKFFVGAALFLSLLFLFYRIIHYCMRLKLIARLMEYTSLTRYKFWGRRYKALKNF